MPVLPLSMSWFRRARPTIPAGPQSIHDATLGLIREQNLRRTIEAQNAILEDYDARERARLRDEDERNSELLEMTRMSGAGPWRMPGASGSKDDTGYPTALREVGISPYIAQGAYGDVELMLSNVEWKRETALSWLEFTRWGIQQIILIARLRCLKDPMLQRGMNVSAQYVFGRVEITSDDKATAAVLDDWRKRNNAVLGHSGLADQHRAKFHDGNIFWVNFTDSTNTGEVNIRTIDAVEMMDIITDPDDSSVAWYYKRDWVQQEIAADGTRQNVHKTAWYPALNYEPTGAARLSQIAGVEVLWDSPVYHRKCGAPGKWHFGLPLVYAALDWAQAVRRFLQDCMTIRNSLAQFSMILQTKGGQQALQGIKTQLSTTVGPNASLWEQNPTTTAGGIFASGPGTTLQAFSSKGAGGDPADVRMYKLMVCMVFGIPESFFADMNTSNLATATSLDRPTELNFKEQQEVWIEDLQAMATYQLRKSKEAPSGKFREAFRISIGEDKIAGARVPDVLVVFPAIIESDVPARVGAIVNAMTLGSMGQTGSGIDEKDGNTLLYSELGIENQQEKLEEMYPEKEYDPDRTKEPDPVPAQAMPPASATPEQQVKEASDALQKAVARISAAVRTWESKEA